ncbi:MAG: hypothetical protein ACLTUB_01730 [Bifidobacterium longum]
MYMWWISRGRQSEAREFVVEGEHVVAFVPGGEVAAIGVAVASATTETLLTFIAVLPEVNPCDDMSSVTVPEALPTSSRV